MSEMSELERHFIGICPRCGREVWDSPRAAAIAAGGVDVTDEVTLYTDDLEPRVQYSVLWNWEGWRGGLGGGVRTSCTGGGWENF